MPEKELIDYLKENLAKGYTPEQLRQALLDSGRQASAVDEAFVTAMGLDEAKPAPPVQKPTDTTTTHLKRITLMLAILLVLGALFYFFVMTR